MNAQTFNRTFDLLSLVKTDTALAQSGRYYSGPCPFCGGKDRFVLKKTPKGWVWFCRKCGEGKYHSSVDYVMLRNNQDFHTALKSMGGDVKDIPSKSIKKVSIGSNDRLVQRIQIRLPDNEWQASALQEIKLASERLLSQPEGQVGREYLQKRGLQKEIWQKRKLGFGFTYEPLAKRKRPALVIPWRLNFDEKETITAVKYRFIDDQPDGLRYIARKGSVQILFGLMDCQETHRILMLIEGEINQLSIQQIRPHGVSAASFGSDSGVRTGIIKELVGRYETIVVWTDDPEKAKAIQSSLQRPAVLIKSPIMDNCKWDANRMLQENMLMDFLSRRLGVACQE